MIRLEAISIADKRFKQHLEDLQLTEPAMKSYQEKRKQFSLLAQKRITNRAQEIKNELHLLEREPVKLKNLEALLVLDVQHDPKEEEQSHG